MKSVDRSVFLSHEPDFIALNSANIRLKSLIRVDEMTVPATRRLRALTSPTAQSCLAEAPLCLLQILRSAAASYILRSAGFVTTRPCSRRYLIRWPENQLKFFIFQINQFQKSHPGELYQSQRGRSDTFDKRHVKSIHQLGDHTERNDGRAKS